MCSIAEGGADSPSASGLGSSRSAPNMPSTACLVQPSIVWPSGSWSGAYERRRSSTTSERIAAKVSRTPSPLLATAANSSARRSLSARERSAIGITCGRSRLLYCSTSGMRRGSSRCASRLAVISWKLCWVSCQRSVAELATNTIPSTPRRMMRRLAAYMAWPGTAASWSLSSWPRKPPDRSGSRSHRIVRSWAELTDRNWPRRPPSARSNRTFRFVVLPPTAGP